MSHVAVVDSTPVVNVPIRSLRTAGSPRAAGENLAHIRALADTQDELPPIIVHRPTMRVIDGLHRLRAARLRNQLDIAVRFFDGAEADAFVVAVRANVTHGLPLSTAERKAAATRIIASHPQWSNRMVATVTGLSPKTVAEIRRNGGEACHSGSRIGQDGRIRPVDNVEKRRHASNLMLANPNLSLRKVARAVGISPETARSVRARLRVGEDPVLAEKKAGTNQPATAAERSHPADRSWWSVARADPVLRFTENGRMLLRLLDMHTMSSERWASMVSNVPVHCRPTIAKVAMECAQAWHLFSEQLERDGTTDSFRRE